MKDGGEIGKVTYLPRKEVIKEEKSTTKIRVVFDASAKKRDAVSLNEILYEGPSLTPELFTLLIKFRIYPIAISILAKSPNIAWRLQVFGPISKFPRS